MGAYCNELQVKNKPKRARVENSKQALNKVRRRERLS
jgi:hypothetical protein